jgi:hypothetical protein
LFFIFNLIILYLPWCCFIFIFEFIVFKWFSYRLPVMWLKMIRFPGYRSHLGTLKLRCLFDRKKSANLPICIAKSRTQGLFNSLKMFSLLFIPIRYNSWLFYLWSVCLFYLCFICRWLWICSLINNYNFLRYHCKGYCLLFWVYWIRSWELWILFTFLDT